MLSLFSLRHVVNYIFKVLDNATHKSYLLKQHLWREAHTLAEIYVYFCCRVFFVSVLHFVYVFCIFKLSLCGPHKISVYVICINLCNLCKFYARNKKKISCDFGLSFELSFMWSNVCFIFIFISLSHTFVRCSSTKRAK